MSKTRSLSKTLILNSKELTEGVFVLSFQRTFAFKAGQVIAIDLVPEGQPRLYSIASGEQDDWVDILFDEKVDGKLTPHLSKLKKGDFVYISAPFGNFTSKSNPAFWIAAGTGIAPFVSMARSGLAVNKTLIHGGKLDSNFYFSELLLPILKDNYIRCSSQQDDTIGFQGRLTEWLKKQEKLPLNMPYLLCGSPEMVVEVRDILISKGIDFKMIVSETYF